MLVSSSVVLCRQSVLEVGTSCMIQYSKTQQVLPFGGKTNLIKKLLFEVSINVCLFKTSTLLSKSFKMQTGRSPATTVRCPLLEKDPNTTVVVSK